MKKLFGENAFNQFYERNNRQILSENMQIPKHESYTGGTFDSALNQKRITKAVALESYQNFQPEHQMQNTIRQYFGKGNINYNTIASHPDFKHLVSSEEYIKQYICTMFVDIKGSTTLSLKYELEFVHQFKNAVIQACIECMRAFDGYVHRIMGDAVLGFFGSQAISKEQAILDCMNCAATLNIFLIQNIQPWLKEVKPEFQDEYDFGFRIGCNFGDDDDVLWANYGFGKTGEVSPTGFSVDLAAKLQGLSGKNKAMMGQGLLEFMNWPKSFSEVKIKIKDGMSTEMPFVKPNYMKDGKPINYIMRELKQEVYLRGLPIPTDIKTSLTSGIIHCNQISMINILKVPGEEEVKFFSNAKIAPIGSSIDFTIKVYNDNSLRFPLTVKFKKVNQEGYGLNHPDVMKTLYQDDSVEHVFYYSSTRRLEQPLFQTKTVSRDCMYKGIHQMICEVRDNTNKVIFREIVNVPIA